MDESSSVGNFDADMTGDGRGRKGRQPKPELEREYSDLTKQKHEEIVQRLLTDFDMEETKDKYRSNNQVVYVPRKKGLADDRFRSDLRKLMGSDEIHFNDRRWTHLYQKRLQEEYQRQLDQKEALLAEAEVMRVRKLKLDGLVSEHDSVHGKTSKRSETGSLDGQTGRQRHKRESLSQQRRRSPSNTPRRRSPSNTPRRRSSSGRRKSAPSRKVKWSAQTEDTGTLMELICPEEDEMITLKKSSVKMTTGPSSEEIKDSSNAEETKEEKQNKKKKKPQEINQLYSEETVDGLYSLAAQLIVKQAPAEPMRERVFVHRLH